MYKDISKAKVLVIGDIMLDKYYHGSSDRISPEAPVPVVNVNDIEDRVGGAGNVAFNIASLGGNVGICALVGKDESAKILSYKLKNNNVETYFAETDYPTITKLRVLAQRHQLVRIDFEQNFNNLDKTSLLRSFDEALMSDYNTVILSDYGKGTLSDTQAIIKKSKANRCVVLVDPKGSDFSKYAGADIITPNLKEFEVVVGKCETEEQIVEKAMELAHRHNIENVLVTRSEKGMTIVSRDGSYATIPTVAKDVFDVTGAGDTVIATLAIGVSLGYSMVESMKVANAAAGVVVGKVGTACVSPKELHYALKKQDTKFGVVTLDEIVDITNSASLLGEKVVMTNGCFDILHAGHVEYLQAARKLGNRLLVAVNTDESISRLKGPERPIVPLQARMELLSALSCVDWVVPFSDDTPEDIIEKITPHILVKGADYTVDNIVGAKHVIANGGEVKTITLKDGFSTSNIVNKIKNS